VKIIIGKKYHITDYEGNDLPGEWIPITFDGWWYQTITPQGGFCHVKPSEFKEQIKEGERNEK